MFFNWMKAHVGIQGNEMADCLAKRAATEDIGETVYDKIPRETIITEEKENGLTKWQEQWTRSTKGVVSKLFSPNIKDRMKTMIVCALHKAYTGDRAWMTIGDRLQVPSYLSRVDYHWKIRARKQRTDI